MKSKCSISGNELDILKIINVNFIQNLQDYFAKSMDISMQSFTNGIAVTNPSNFIDFCSKHTQSSAEGKKRCEECFKKWVNAVSKEKKLVMFKCHAGLSNFGIPIIVDKNLVGIELGGKVLTKEADEKHFRKLAKELGIDEEKYVEASKELRIIPAEIFQGIAEALYITINNAASIAFANHKLSKVGINYKIQRNVAIEEWLTLNYEKARQPLSAREFEILKLLVMGKSNTEIAKDLFISTHTVKAHVSSIIEKFMVEDRVQVAVKAVREGLI